MRSAALVFVALASLPGCPPPPAGEPSTTGSSGEGSGSSGGSSGTGTTGVASTSSTSGDPTEAGTQTVTSSGGSGSSSGTTGAPDPYPEADALFAVDAIAELDITLSDNAILALNANPRVYTKGDLVAKIGGQVYELPEIGVRLKGVYGSFRTLDQKAAFLLNFDRYVPDQQLLGLEKLAVNNMVQDCSMQREILAYTLFRDAGVPSSRAGYATVRVNGELYGLYTTVEATDNEELLDHWFESSKGSLYEGAYGSDIVTELVPSFDLDNGPDVAFADLFEWAAALDGMTDPKTFAADVDAIVDLDRYLAFAAAEIYLGHWDGYAWTRNNYFVYRRPSDLRWLFMPWGTDQTLRQHLDPFGGQGRLEQMCAASQPCRDLLAGHFMDTVARVDALDLPGLAAQLAELTADAVAADPRKECDVPAHQQSVLDNIQFYADRKGTIAAGLLCTVPAAVDADKDGFSACIDDCDDNSAGVHPGAPEVCDLDDDNCNGVWDDDPKCPHCVTKDLPGPGTAAFCFVALDFTAARADCKAKGGDLLSIHSQAIQDWTVQQAFAIQASDWWMGLHDEAQEGSFVWTDGTPLDFTTWNEGEPNNAGNEDCASLPIWAGGLWNDLPCGATLPYVCRTP